MRKPGKLLLAGVVLTLSHAVVLAQGEAERYAGDLLRAAEFVSAHHIAEKDAGQLAAWALEALHDAVHEKMTRDLRERLRDMSVLSDIDRLVLVREARAAIGYRNELASGRDLKVS